MTEKDKQIQELRRQIEEMVRKDGYIEAVLKKAIEKYGKPVQSVVAMEELSELQKELSKAIRGMFVTGNYDTQGMLEEVADVMIMLRQIIMMYNLDEEAIQTVMYAKIVRLDRRIDQ